MMKFKQMGLFAIALVFLISSCSKTEQLTIEGSNDINDYPQEITLENMHLFVNAPQEIIDIFHEKEMAMVERSTASEGTQAATNAKVAGWKFFWVRAFNGTWAPLSNTLVEIASESILTNSDPVNNGVILNSAGNDPLCYYHDGISTESYSSAQWLEGISTFDIVRIDRHRNGVEPFTTVREYFAADINQDGNLTDADTDALRDLIQHLRSDLPTTRSHNQPVMYVMAHEYESLQGQLDNDDPNGIYLYTILHEVCMGSNIAGDYNRYAIKRGDVSGSWNF